jgi:hypothetical protein
LILREQHNTIKNEPMDTSIDQRDEKLKDTCNWCGYKGHFERECRQKTTERPRKVSPPNTFNTTHGLLKCFCCSREGHYIADCKTKVVFLTEESGVESNKNNLSYFESLWRERNCGWVSEIESVL